MRTVSDQLESDPEINDNGNELQRVDVETLLDEICRFPGGVNVLHGETEEKEIVTHDAPHDGEIRRPTS